MNDSNTDEQPIRIPPHEKEVYEGRFQATKAEAESVCDRFIQNHDYEGIRFLEIIIGTEGNRRIYYGTLWDRDSSTAITRTLGYVETTPLKRLRPIGLRVRIVCAWPPMMMYWEELASALQDVFLVITKDARVKDDNAGELIDLTQKPPGRPAYNNYDIAYQRLLDGEDYQEVFAWWCQEETLRTATEADRRRFKEAIRYRHKKGTKKI